MLTFSYSHLQFLFLNVVKSFHIPSSGTFSVIALNTPHISDKSLIFGF